MEREREKWWRRKNSEESAASKRSGQWCSILSSFFRCCFVCLCFWLKGTRSRMSSPGRSSMSLAAATTRTAPSSTTSSALIRRARSGRNVIKRKTPTQSQTKKKRKKRRASEVFISSSSISFLNQLPLLSIPFFSLFFSYFSCLLAIFSLCWCSENVGHAAVGATEPCCVRERVLAVHLWRLRGRHGQG
jgi:hypothetical protein